MYKKCKHGVFAVQTTALTVLSLASLGRAIVEGNIGYFALAIALGIFTYFGWKLAYELYAQQNGSIRYNVYFGGRVQSLSYFRNGVKVSVGVVAPGERFDFGPLTAREVVEVVDGALIINGDFHGMGQTVAVDVGGPMTIKARFDVACAYRCITN